MPDLFVSSQPTQNQPATEQLQSNIIAPVSHNAHFFSTYCENPKNIHFGLQEPQEEVLLFLRKDFITNVPWILSTLILALAPFLFEMVTAFSGLSLTSIPQNFLFILLAFYYLIVATYVFVNFITWYFNNSLITSIRVVDVDFEDIIYKNISETKLSLVQDVSYKQIGAIQTFYDFGNVLIQTAAPVDNFVLELVPQPQHVVEVIEDLIGRRGRPGAA